MLVQIFIKLFTNVHNMNNIMINNKVDKILMRQGCIMLLTISTIKTEEKREINGFRDEMGF